MADLTLNKALGLSTLEIKNLSDTDKTKFNELIAKYRKEQREARKGAIVNNPVTKSVVLAVSSIKENKDLLILSCVGDDGNKLPVFMSFKQRESNFPGMSVEEIEVLIDTKGSFIATEVEEHIEGKTSFFDASTGKTKFHETTGSFVSSLIEFATTEQVQAYKDNYSKLNSTRVNMKLFLEAKALGLSIEEFTALQSL